MKTLKTNLNRFLHLNSLMLLTWYLIFTSHIPPSTVLSYCPDHAIAFVLCLHAFLIGIFLHWFLSIFYLLIFINSQLPHTFWGSFSKLLFILILDFLTHTFKSQKRKEKKILLSKNKTTILTRGRQRSPLLLTFSGAILRLLHIIFALLLPGLSFQTPSPLHCSPNSL